MRNRDFLPRLLQRIDDVGTSRRDVSLRAGLSSDAVRNMERHPDHAAKIETIAKLADALDVSPRWLLFGDEHAGPKLVPVIGRVSANRWRDPTLGGDDPSGHPGMPPDPRYAFASQFALEVDGPSLDRVAPQGSLLLCVTPEGAGRAPRDGDIVVVENRRGDLIETTAKRWRKRGTLVELTADSNHPLWRDIKYLIDTERSDTARTYHLRGIVTAVLRPL